jgi:hypothetical protein
VAELLDSISYRELVDWSTYYRVEPWGEQRADMRSAQVASTLANINRDRKLRPEPFTLLDFMLFKPDAPPKPAEDTTKIAPAVVSWLFQKSGARLKE